MSDFAYKVMAKVGLPIRNIFMPPGRILDEVEIKPGDRILDYGCGPGVFSIMMAKKTGPSGTVHALDRLTNKGLFELRIKGKRSFTFGKVV